MATRLFHTVIMVGVALGASLAAPGCGGNVDTGDDKSDAPADTGFAGIAPGGDGWSGIGADTRDIGHDTGRDTGHDTGWVGIRPADTGLDGWPPIPPAHDTGIDTGTDTGWGGIRPADTGTDTGWVGILPPPADSGVDSWHTIVADTGVDTFPGITPVIDTGIDTFPGIAPPPPPPSDAG